MVTVSVPNWEAFTIEFQKLRAALPRGPSGRPPEFLFRGQSNSAWPLTTTLERAGCENMSFEEYYHLTVQRVRPAVEALTRETWDVPDYDPSIEHAFRTDRELFSLYRFPSVSFYRYMTYLRHHRFPSPLLDWSSSANVAAFFAFEPRGESTRSIYVYCESPLGFKGGAVGEPAMRPIGKYVRTHARHFRQQSDYTICATFDEKLPGWRFHPHDEVFWNRGRQDCVWKFDLPATQRIPVLTTLDQYNLNSFSLFDSPESLLETMWMRERELKVGVLPMTLPSEFEIPFTSRTLAELLKQHGFDTHPKGMVQPFGVDFDTSPDGRTTFLDVNADAVRQNGEVPDRPIRLTFERVGMRANRPLWRLKSISELQPGVDSRALDRLPETPKTDAPWPD